MSNKVMKSEQRNVDGFDAYEDAIEGEEEQSPSGRVIQGTRLKFTNEACWIDDADNELPAGLELVVVDIGRVVQKWIDQQPAETIMLGPGERFPEVAKLNADCPKSEWREGPNGQLQGPWQAQHIAYLLDPKTMSRFTWPTSTVGGAICIRDIVDRTKWMRRYRGEHVYPVVELSDTFMNTRFGGRQRPHFNVKRWVALGGAGGNALPAPEQPTLPPAESSSTKETLDKFATAGARTVDAAICQRSHRG